MSGVPQDKFADEIKKIVEVFEKHSSDVLRSHAQTQGYALAALGAVHATILTFRSYPETLAILAGQIEGLLSTQPEDEGCRESYLRAINNLMAAATVKEETSRPEWFRGILNGGPKNHDEENH